ncbi:YbhB/YbcL family Raf kinase inhibitor-like protein [Nostoc sp. CMAA1605]|uniref:YbhB/YbcL family Raf kinase inhibitor-like protein n=1 Tax=Nostoc sp. CMAA1605 TaxID=2055159 RepID=UPI001F2473E5|nr:hypothetical protein [Nostoc sp. CMAA1605]
MKLISDSFSANSMIPTKFSCEGAGISPSLKWEDAPKETQSFALIVDDTPIPLHPYTPKSLHPLEK